MTRRFRVNIINRQGRRTSRTVTQPTPDDARAFVEIACRPARIVSVADAETVLLIEVAPTRCVICARPAPAVTLGPWPLCDVCAAACDAPDGLCFECGLPLTEAEIAAGRWPNE